VPGLSERAAIVLSVISRQFVLCVISRKFFSLLLSRLLEVGVCSCLIRQALTQADRQAVCIVSSILSDVVPLVLSFVLVESVGFSFLSLYFNLVLFSHLPGLLAASFFV